MTVNAKVARGSLMAALVGLISASQAGAGYLEQYEFQGQSGSQTSLAPLAGSVATGLTGMSFGESSVLTPSAGVNSMNSSGWNLANAYYSAGFTVNAGYTATISDIIMTSRSSGTGPGLINVEVSIGGGPMTLVASIAQSGTNYNDEDLILNAPVKATSGQSIVFYFEAANQTSANAGTIGSTGTFRVGDYDPTGAAAPTPFTFNGSVTLTPNAIPEPASVAMLGLGLAVVAGLRLARRAS